jgi:hypothetical protein
LMNMNDAPQSRARPTSIARLRRITGETQRSPLA